MIYVQAPQQEQDLSPVLADSAAAAASHTSPTSTEPTAVNAGHSDAVAPVADSTFPATREADANSQQSRQPSAGTLLAVSQDEQQDAPQPVLNSSPAAEKQLKGDSISRPCSLNRQLSDIPTSLTQPGDVAAATTSVVRHASLPPASQHAVLHSQAEHADVESGSKGGASTCVAVATEVPDEQGSSASKNRQQECDQRCQELEQQSR